MSEMNGVWQLYASCSCPRGLGDRMPRASGIIRYRCLLICWESDHLLPIPSSPPPRRSMRSWRHLFTVQQVRNTVIRV